MPRRGRMRGVVMPVVIIGAWVIWGEKGRRKGGIGYVVGGAGRQGIDVR